jgi:hypothetical protein
MTTSYKVPSKYLDRKDSFDYYGKELPDYLQDPHTQGILKTSSMDPKEALNLATEEQKERQRNKTTAEKNDGEYIYQIKQLEKGKQSIQQAERGAKLYEKYKQRNTRRMTPDSVNVLIANVNSTRKNKGGRRRRYRTTMRKSRNHRKTNRRHRKRRA